MDLQKIHAQQDGTVSSETGDKDTGIRSQRELEGLRVALEDRIAYLEPELKEMRGQLQKAAQVIARQQHEILRLKAELYDSLSAHLASEDPES